MNSEAVRLAKELSNLPAATMFNDWKRVVRELVNMGFNRWEVEAILTSDIVATAEEVYGTVSTAVAKTAKDQGLSHHSKAVNALVMARFGAKFGLVLNDEGIPCTEGTMPGNPGAGKIKVPLGTPLSCDPTSETYWSM